MPLRDISNFDFDSDDDANHGLLANNTSTPRIPTQATMIYVNTPPSVLLSRERFESHVANYERSLASRANNGMASILSTPKSVKYLSAKELSAVRSQVYDAYTFLPEKYNLEQG